MNKLTSKKPFRIKCLDGLGNTSYLSRGDYNQNGVSYVSSTEQPLALSNLVQRESAELRFALNDAPDGNAAIAAVRKAWRKAFPNAAPNAEREKIILID